MSAYGAMAEWRLVRRPVGEPTADDVELVEMSLPPLDEGEALVRNTFLSVDPYMRGRMNDVPSYVPPFPLGGPMDGGAVGVVESVRGEVTDRAGRAVRRGDTVLHDAGWRTHALLTGRAVRVVDAKAAPAQSYLGILGMPRRVYTYPALPSYGLYNFISSVSAFIMGIAGLLLVIIVYHGIKYGKKAGNDPWNGFTLEWMAASPPALKNFDSLPVVNSRRPLWDLKHPENPDDE